MLHVCAVSNSDFDLEKRSLMCILGSLQHAISNRLCRSRPCYQTSTDSYLVRSCASIRFWKPLKASQVMQGMYLPRKTSSKDAYAKAYAPSRIKFLHQTSTSASNRSKNEPLIILYYSHAFMKNLKTLLFFLTLRIILSSRCQTALCQTLVNLLS